jgi:acetylglutamate kinase
VLAGMVNKEIVNLVNTNGGNAVGLCGVDNMLLRARKQMKNGMDLGLVGEITSVNVQFLTLLLQNGMMPVIAPIGAGENGEIFNINADLAAGAVAAALKAEKLVYLSDTEGILVRQKLISTLTKSEADKLVAEGAIFGGMIPKVTSAFDTLGSGVNKVHLIDGRVKHSLLLEIFTDEGIGTQMIHEE